MSRGDSKGEGVRFSEEKKEKKEKKKEKEKKEKEEIYVCISMRS